MSFFRDQLESWLKTIDVKAESVLDVGGAALPVKDRVKSWEVEEYKILDNGLEGKRGNYNFDLNRIVDHLKEFDVIFCLEVFEYIWNPVQAIENLAYFTKEGGTAYMSFPLIYPHHEPRNEDYLRYTESGIVKLMTYAGFRIDEITPRVDRSGLLASFYKADGMHPVKGKDMTVTGFMVKATK